MQNSRQEANGRRAAAGLAAAMAVFVVLGTPLMFYLWNFVNDLFAARITAIRIAAALPVLLLFGVCLAVLAGRVRIWEARRAG